MVTLWVGKMWRSGAANSPKTSTTLMRCKKKSWRCLKGNAADFYDSGIQSWFQDLINVWTMPATMLKNKVMYRQFFQCRFCKLKMLYMFKNFVSLLSGHASCMCIYMCVSVYSEVCCNERMLQRTVFSIKSGCYNEHRCYNERRGILSVDVARACAWRVGLSRFD